ncbi:MAG: PQQ-binding-like beta-propeller repeat protein [Verrucomicrobiales bacterium]
MRFLAAASWVFWATATLGAAADWPQFLGPQRDGRTEEQVTVRFGAEGPEIAWKTAVGRGLAGPSVVEGRVVLFHREGGEAVVQAWSAADGKPLWRHAAPTGYRDDFGFDDGPRSAPTLSQEKVFAYGADGRLTCLDASTGQLLWSRDLEKELESPKGWFGRACAPLVVGDRVVVQVGGRWQGKPAGVVAFEIDDGSVAWAGGEDEASYSSPIQWDFPAGPAVVCWTRRGVALFDPTSGRQLGREPFEPDIEASVSACTPIALGPDTFFLSGCYGMGARVWRVGEAFKLEPVWARSGALDCHYGTPVPHGGHLYGFHGRQEQGQELCCVEGRSGARQWSARLPAGSVLLANDTLVVLTEKGELIIAPATPSGFQPSARGQILAATTRAFPALSGGLLFARDGKQLVAVRCR